MVSVIVVIWVTPPAVPVIVIVRVPVVALRLTVTVMVDVPEPGAGIELGLNLTVTRDPWPLADKPIAELKPPEIAVVIVDVPELPRATLSDVGEALMVKFEFVPVTVSDTVVVATVLPEVPVTVIVYVPTAVDEPTVIVMVELPAPATEVGLKLTVTPDGCPVAVKLMAPLKPPVTVLVIVEVPAWPCTTETEAGEAERLKPGDDVLGASALSKADPFGLPQPVAKS
jgi:hypothetical protein